MTHDPRVDAIALDWLIRQRDPSFTDWEAFSDWLAVSPSHAEAYHEVAALDVEAIALPGDKPPAAVIVSPWAAPSDEEKPVRRWAGRRLLLSGALAAALVGIVSVNLMERAPDGYRIETQPGEIRTITLKDGSRVAINGGSAIRLSTEDPRSATLERGQALFTVVHRPEAPFRVAVGDAQLVDIGTIFDVTRTGKAMVVAVSEGAVAFNPDAANVRVDAGRRLAVQDGGDAQLSRIDPASVGGWKSGQLVYDGARLEDVAAEVTRTTGVVVHTTPTAASISFRGALQTSVGEAQMVSDLAALSGTRASHDDKGWTLSK